MLTLHEKSWEWPGDEACSGREDSNTVDGKENYTAKSMIGNLGRLRAGGNGRVSYPLMVFICLLMFTLSFCASLDLDRIHCSFCGRGWPLPLKPGPSAFCILWCSPEQALRLGYSRVWPMF